MIREYKNMKVEEFESIDSFLNSTKGDNYNSVFKGQYHTSTEEDMSRSPWAGTHTYEEAEELKRTGYKKGLNDLKNCKVNVKQESCGVRSRETTGIVGYAPHVPNCVMNVPMSMLQRTYTPSKTKTITILFNRYAHCGVKKEDFVSAGKHVMDLIKAIERRGVKVRLYIGGFARTKHGLTSSTPLDGMVVKVKDFSQPLNMLKLSYPMIHPSFIRRQFFAWMERSEAITDNDYTIGYGYPIANSSTQECRNALTERGLLTQDLYYTDTQEASKYEGNDLAKQMGIVIK